jgi:hypothetical protein
MDWVPAGELLAALSPKLGTYEAIIAICTRAHRGVLRARAQHLFLDGKKQAESEIDPGFWWACGHVALEQNWELGDFETWIDNRRHWQAFGVSFCKADAIDMGAEIQPRALPSTDLARLALDHINSAKPRWDYIETVAWIMCRSDNIVDGVAGFRSSFEHEIGQDIEAGIVMALRSTRYPAGECDRAEADLAWKAVRGEIVARGIPNGGQRHDIPAEDWDARRVYLQNGDYVLAPDMQRIAAARFVGMTQWTSLQFDAAKVRGNWPAVSKEASTASDSGHAVPCAPANPQHRPSHALMCLHILAQRITSGEVLPDVNAEAAAIEKALSGTKKQTAARTVKRHIISVHAGLVFSAGRLTDDSAREAIDLIGKN